MDTSKIINDGDTQMFRLPDAYHFDYEEVFIKKAPKGVLLIPKDDSIWEKNVNKYDEPFMIDGNQPEY